MSLAVLADHMASKGRGPDSMLIHMSPREVQGLQALAENHGGSLTINPETGLPEAGFLDKLLPTIIGAGISFFSQGTIDPMTAAAMVGGAQTVRTGDIGKGIQAGLGAYSGASLTAGMAGTGADAMTTAGMGNYAETLAAQGLQAGTPAYGEAASQLALESQKEALATPFADRLSTGYEAVKKAGPMQYLKANAIPLAGAFGPAILAGANAKENMPKTTTGMITPYSFDPYSGTYTAATPYRAAEGGLMGMAAGGMAGYGDGDDVPRRVDSGGMFDFTQRSEPVARMAKGGIAHYAIGGDTKAAIDAAYAAGDYGAVQNLVQQNQITAADVANTYKGFDTSGLAGLGINLYNPAAEKLYQDTGSWEAAAKARDDAANAANLATWNAQNKTTADANNAANTAAWNAQNQATWAAQPIQYTDAQIGKYLTDNPNVDIAKAITETRADPAAVNRYIASLDNPFRGSTETTGGSGTLGIYNQMKAQGIDPNELYAANLAVDPKYAGWSQADITKGYNLDKGAYALTDQIARDKIAADPKLGYDKQWVKFMDDNKYSINDAAQAFGLPIKEVRDRYNAVKAAETKVVTPPVTPVTPRVTNLAGVPIIPGVNDYGLGGSGTSGALESIYGPALPPGVSGAGITTVNPNGTITTRPDLTLPMSTVRDDYVRGGGSLGYTSPTFASLKAVEDKYPLRGGSKQSYDYLTGKTDYDPVPYTKTGELMKPYGESVLGMPANVSKKMYLFDPTTKTYKINPDYAIPTYDKDGKKSLNLTNADVINYVKSPEYSNDDAFVSWMTANNLTPEQVAAATGISIADVYKKIKKAKPVETVANAAVTGQNDTRESGGAAAGGLMGMARGGMAQQFNLGDYSDGGRLLRGPGDGVSDSIPASIGGKRPARLADGEFVVPARIVSELGNGSTEAGARKLYAMMDRIQSARQSTVGKGRVAKNSRAEKYLPA